MRGDENGTDLNIDRLQLIIRYLLKEKKSTFKVSTREAGDMLKADILPRHYNAMCEG